MTNFIPSTRPSLTFATTATAPLGLHINVPHRLEGFVHVPLLPRHVQLVRQLPGQGALRLPELLGDQMELAIILLASKALTLTVDCLAFGPSHVLLKKHRPPFDLAGSAVSSRFDGRPRIWFRPRPLLRGC